MSIFFDITVLAAQEMETAIEIIKFKKIQSTYTLKKTEIENHKKMFSSSSSFSSIVVVLRLFDLICSFV